MLSKLARKSVFVMMVVLLSSLSFSKSIINAQIVSNTATYTIAEVTSPDESEGKLIYSTPSGLDIVQTFSGYYIKTPDFQLLLIGEPMPIDAIVTNTQVGFDGDDGLITVDGAIIRSLITFMEANPASFVRELVIRNLRIVITYEVTPTVVNTAPGAFEILSPIGGTSDNSVRPTFNWTPSIDAENDPVTYSLYLGTTDTTTFPPILEPNIQLVAAGITTTEYTLDYDLKYNSPYVWYVESTDGEFITKSNTSKFNTIVRPNNAPVANAGVDQVANSGDLVTLDGTGTYDPDGDQIGFIWSSLDGGGFVLENTNTLNPTFVAPEVTVPTQFRFKLWVTDSQLESTDEVVITVNPLQ